MNNKSMTRNDKQTVLAAHKYTKNVMIDVRLVALAHVVTRECCMVTLLAIADRVHTIDGGRWHINLE